MYTFWNFKHELKLLMIHRKKFETIALKNEKLEQSEIIIFYFQN